MLEASKTFNVKVTVLNYYIKMKVAETSAMLGKVFCSVIHQLLFMLTMQKSVLLIHYNITNQNLSNFVLIGKWIILQYDSHYICRFQTYIC